ncbi:hypothetical protein EKO27_g877 [Xylaria grammica]|uniref:Pre-rRNA-processing protein RIX1 n=1 Tax=Xylaria grammica TaxID=363999 RepID=A0A439DIL7_9PEZI|nr:hypothetical protein EKO27_g877 [Xylaria grammica]
MHDHPTLVREIVTPSLSGFANACLQVLKPPASSKVGKAPYSLVETIFEALSTLIPLHPTTIRQFSGKFKAEIRPFLAPTIADNILVPITLQGSSRRLAIRLHMTAAKGGDSTEWIKHVEELVKTLHSTGDQVFRAVKETWESTIGHKPQPVNINAEPQGGSENLDQLPLWVGMQAGGERMIGLLDFIIEYLHCRTRVAVTLPITAIVDVTSRISSIRPPSSSKQKLDLGMNHAIGREERDELWAVFPDIQVAAMRVHLALIRRLEKNYTPLVQQTLDHTLRILQSTYRLPHARTTAFMLVKEMLHLCGPTLPKFTVESLGLLMQCCCRDLLGAAGYLPRATLQSSSLPQNGQKPQTGSQNADAFIPGKSQHKMLSVSLGIEHLSAAEAFLTTLFGHLPQQHIPSPLRSQMLKAAILSRNRNAQVASILHPARDESGRPTQTILPYLTQQFPHDETVEILRFNFRPTAAGQPNDFMETDDAMAMEGDQETGGRTEAGGLSFGQDLDTSFSGTFAAPAPTTRFKASSPVPTRNVEAAQTPFLVRPSEAKVQLESEIAVEPSATLSPLKRKNEDASAEISLSKRVEIDITRAPGPARFNTTTPANKTATVATISEQTRGPQDGENETSDDESVHLNMDLDSDDEDEGDE